MKKILTFIILLFAFFLCKAQTTYPPSSGSGSVPSSKTYWYDGDVVRGIYGLFGPVRDTNWTPRYPFAIVQWQHAGVDTVLWQYDGFKWNKVGSGGSSTTPTWEEVMTQSPDFSTSHTSDFNNNNWVLNNLGEFHVNASEILFFNQYSFPTTDGTTNQILATDGFGGLYWADGGGGTILDTTTDWSVDSTVNAPPVGTPIGSKVRVGTSPSGVFIGHENEIATSDGAGGFTYQTANEGDLLYDANTDFVWKYSGGVWTFVGKLAIHQGGDRFGATVTIGSNDNYGLNFRTNGITRMNIAGTGVTRILNLSGAAAGLAGASTNGTLSNVQIGSGLLLSSGVLSSTVSGGITTADNGLTANTATNVRLGGTLVTNTTIDGAFTLNLNPSRTIINAADSVLVAATNKVSLASLDSINARGAVLYFKGARTQVGATSLASLVVNTNSSDSVGFRIQNGEIYVLGTAIGTGSISRIDATTKKLSYSSTINAATELTGIVPVENGGTEVASLTAYGLIFGGTTTTGPVQTLINGTSGYYLKSNGASALPSWETTAGLSPFTRGIMPGVNSLNLIYQATQSDSVVLGVLTTGTPSAKNHVVGTTYINSQLSVGASSTLVSDPTYEIGTNGEILGGALRINNNMSLGTFANPVAGMALTMAGSYNGAISQSFTQGTNGTIYNVNWFSFNGSQTTAAGGYNAIVISANNNVDGSSTQTSALYRGVLINLNTKSNSTTPVTAGEGIRFTAGNVNSRTQTFTTIKFITGGIVSGDASGGLITTGGTYAFLYADSINNTMIANATNKYQLYTQDNSAKTLINIFENKTSIGTTTAPTGLLYLGAGTATVASEVNASGTLLSTIISGAKEYNNAFYLSNSALNRAAVGGAINDFTADGNNSGTGETDLQTYTTKANTLTATGEKIIYEVSGTFNDLTATAQLQFYFGGTNIGNTGALTVSATGGWYAKIIVIRTGASTARSVVTLSTPGASTAQYTTETDITGLTFANTNIIKITGTAGGASGGSNDITSKLGTIFWFPAAAN